MAGPEYSYSLIGALLVALPNLYFVKRWIEAIDRNFEIVDKRFEETADRLEKVEKAADAGEAKARNLQKVMEIKGCFDDTPCPVDERDKTPPMLNRHGRRINNFSPETL